MDQHDDRRKGDQAKQPASKKEWRRPSVTTFGDFAKLTGAVEASRGITNPGV